MWSLFRNSRGPTDGITADLAPHEIRPILNYWKKERSCASNQHKQKFAGLSPLHRHRRRIPGWISLSDIEGTEEAILQKSFKLEAARCTGWLYRDGGHISFHWAEADGESRFSGWSKPNAAALFEQRLPLQSSAWFLRSTFWPSISSIKHIQWLWQLPIILAHPLQHSLLLVTVLNGHCIVSL